MCDNSYRKRIPPVNARPGLALGRMIVISFPHAPPIAAKGRLTMRVLLLALAAFGTIPLPSRAQSIGIYADPSRGAAIVNGPCSVAIQSTSWSRVKAMFN